jgi:hypothetical protein
MLIDMLTEQIIGGALFLLKFIVMGLSLATIASSGRDKRAKVYKYLRRENTLPESRLTNKCSLYSAMVLF